MAYFVILLWDAQTFRVTKSQEIESAESGAEHLKKLEELGVLVKYPNAFVAEFNGGYIGNALVDPAGKKLVNSPLPIPSLTEIDQNRLNTALAEQGSVVRAFALLLLEDRNNMCAAVASATSLADLKTRFPKSITTPQFVAALQNKMRD